MTEATSLASYETPLYKLLFQRLPAYRDRGRLDVPAVAAELKVSRAAVYRWLKQNRLPSRQARRFIATFSGALSIKDLISFVIADA